MTTPRPRPLRKPELLRDLASLASGEPRLLAALGVDGATLAAVLEEAAVALQGSGPRGESFQVFVDGASRGNPGHSAAGYVILDGDGRVLAERGVYLGKGTNNEAEYRALIHALEALQGSRGGLAVFSDSELMVKQLRGEYRVREPRLAVLHAAVRDLLRGFAPVGIRHIPRERNARADALANKAIDDYIRGR
jgi:ribonuclease HI